MSRYLVTLSKRVYVAIPVEADCFEDAVGAARSRSDYSSVAGLSVNAASVHEDEGWQVEMTELDQVDRVITTSRGLSYGDFGYGSGYPTYGYGGYYR